MFKVDEDVLVRIFVVVLCALDWIVVLLGTDEGALGGLATLEDAVDDANCREMLDIELGTLEVLYILD